MFTKLQTFILLPLLFAGTASAPAQRQDHLRQGLVDGGHGGAYDHGHDHRGVVVVDDRRHSGIGAGTGALIGAGGGAALGAALGGGVGGTLVGAAVGAGIGAVIANDTKRDNHGHVVVRHR